MKNALLLLVVICSSAALAEISVEDDGKFFSKDAIGKAERLISEVYWQTSPHKQIFFKTVNAVPKGASATSESERWFRTRRIDGVLIYLSKKPQQIVVTVGKETERQFYGKENIKNAMIPLLRKRDFDGSLRAGLTQARSGLQSAFPVQRVTLPENTQTQSEENPFLWVLILGGAAIVLMIIVFMVRGLRGGAGRRPAGNYNDGNYYEGSSGFGRSFFGGVMGSLTGNWLYDRMSDSPNHHSPYSSSNHNASASSSSDSYRSDDGNVGSSTSDSWGDSSSSSSDSSYDSGSSSSDSGSSDSGSSSSSDSW